MMTKRKRKTSLFLDTSAVVYQLHGERRMRAAVDAVTSDGRVAVSTFIRMEWLRGFVLNLIELYFLIKDEGNVSDALIAWTQLKVNQERKHKVVLMTICKWIVEQDDWTSTETSLRRLGESIVRFVRQFDSTFTERSTDHLGCELGRLVFPKRGFDEGMLLSFYDKFRNIQSTTPSCRLCSFTSAREKWLRNCGIDLYSPTQRQRFKSNKGFVKQAERLEKIAEKQPEFPRCRLCEQMGDSIIALQMKRKAILVTVDRAFLAFGDILDREVRLIPSLAALRRLPT